MTGVGAELSYGVTMLVSPRASEYKGFPLLTLSGELDFAMRAELEVATDRLFEAGTRLILDMRDVSLIDSAALGLVIGLHSRVRDSGTGALAVVYHKETGVGRVFDATRLVGVLHLFSDLEGAAAYLDTVREC